MTPGLYPNIPHDTYHSGPEISKSGLDLIAVSPQHYKTGLARTPALDFGGAYDTAVLEPEVFRQRYCPPIEAGWQKKEDKAAWADYLLSTTRVVGAGRIMDDLIAMKKDEFFAAFEELTGKQLIDRADYNTIQSMAAVLRAHPTASEWLADGKAQVSAYATDPETGVACRSRADWFDEKTRIITDLKTCGFRLLPWRVKAECRRYRYPVQDAFYRDVFGWAGCEIAAFRFILQEKAPPYGIRTIHFPADVVEEGRRIYREDLYVYADCLERDEWPGYPAVDIEVNPYYWLDEDGDSDLADIGLQLPDGD